MGKFDNIFNKLNELDFDFNINENTNENPPNILKIISNQLTSHCEK
jgi:hypothetical protein